MIYLSVIIYLRQKPYCTFDLKSSREIHKYCRLVNMRNDRYNFMKTIIISDKCFQNTIAPHLVIQDWHLRNVICIVSPAVKLYLNSTSIGKHYKIYYHVSNDI